MASWSKRKVDASEINKGQEYTKDDNVSVEELNAIVNNSFNAQGEAEKSLNIVKGFQIGTVVSGDTPQAVIHVDSTGEKIILNLVLPKGEKGDKGDKGEAGSQGTMDYNELMNKPAKFLGYLSYNTSSGQTLDDIEELKNIETSPVKQEYGFAYITNIGSYTTTTYLCLISTEWHALSTAQVVFNLSTGEIYQRSKSNFGVWTTFEKTTFLTTTGNAYGAYRDGNGDEITKTYAKKDDLPDTSNFITREVDNLINYTISAGVGSNLSLSIDPSTYVMTLSLKNASGAVLDTKTVDLPLETMVVNASYNNSTKQITLTLQNGTTTSFSVADLVSGLASTSDLQNYLPLTAGSGKAITGDLYVKDGTNTKNIYIGSSGRIRGTDKGGVVISGTGNFMAFRPLGDTNTNGGLQLLSTGFSPQDNKGNSLGTSSLQWNNIYGTTIYQNGKQVANAEDIKVQSVNSKTGAVVLTQDDVGDGNTYKRVTTTEKNTWNNKSDFSGSYNDLTDKPTIPNATTFVKTSGNQTIEGVKNFKDGVKLGNDQHGVTTDQIEIDGGVLENPDLNTITYRGIYHCTKGTNTPSFDYDDTSYDLMVFNGSEYDDDGQGGNTITQMVIAGWNWWIRRNNGSDWGAWERFAKKVDTSSFAKKSDLDSYLLKSGGTITGSTSFNSGLSLRSGVGTRYSAKDNTQFMIYGDSSSQSLWTQIADANANYKWYQLMDINGKLYSGKKEVAIKEDLAPVLLWENASPSSEVVGGHEANLTGDATTYSLLRFDFLRHPTSGGGICFFVKPTVGKNYSFGTIYGEGAYSVYAREATLTNATKVTFKNGYNNNNTANNRLIPVAIYGYKY